MPEPIKRPQNPPPGWFTIEPNNSRSFPRLRKIPNRAIEAFEASFSKIHKKPCDTNPEFFDACHACDKAMGFSAIMSNDDYAYHTQDAAWQSHLDAHMDEFLRNWEWDEWRKLFNVNARMLHAIDGAYKHLEANSPAGEALKRDLEGLLVQWGKL